MATTTDIKKSAAPKRAAKQVATKTAGRVTAARKKQAANQGPKPTTILMVRHGQTPTTGKVLPGRAKGLHLADLGLEQAKIAALRLAELKIDAVYSSPLERAKETAAPISAACGLKTQIERGLFECDFGDWTGKELKDLMKLP